MNSEQIQNITEKFRENLVLIATNSKTGMLMNMRIGKKEEDTLSS